MDGAVTAHLSDPSRRGRLVAALAARERRYYERIAAPDVLIVLRVDPDLAVRRKEGVERESLVRPRAEEIWSLDWSASPALVVDADKPKDDVLRQVRSLIWSRL
jgi:thymidylate kinase